MSKPPGFSDDLSRVAAHVDKDVGNVVKLLRGSPKPTIALSGEPSPTTADVPQTTEAIPTQAIRKTPSHGKTHSRRHDTADDHEAWDNVTTRLRRGTNALLTEAALRQKLKKQHPNTRQDIVEEAVQEWLRKHGYSN